MQLALYLLARSLIRLLQLLPLITVVRVGRCLGALAFHLDKRHRRIALQNLQACFGSELPAPEIQAIAKENFRRIGESYCAAVKTASMPWESLRNHVEFVGITGSFESSVSEKGQNAIIAIGHFGNFELYARFSDAFPGTQCATTYRALRQPLLNRLLLSMRKQSGCLFFERRTEANALKAALSEKRLFLGLLSDQHGGRNGLIGPFLGRQCSTNPAPAVLALRYHCRLYVGICYRIGLARWRIELDREIQTHGADRPRSIRSLTTEINQCLEQAIRRDPANWFWVHNRWKAEPGSKPVSVTPIDLEPPASTQSASNKFKA